MHYACFPQGGSNHYVQYIYTIPTKFAKIEYPELKAKLFKNWQGTTHWPHCNIRVQGPVERDGKPDPQNRTEPFEKPIITDRILQLAAVKAY